MKKVFVTGASGMLGTTLYNVFTDAGVEVVSTDINPLDPWTEELDIRDSQKIEEMVGSSNPDYVLNLAALTDLEYCEKHPQETNDVNTKGAVNVALVCKTFDIPMVHISTAGVFDGLKEKPYTEDDEPNPINVYGETKHRADQMISDTLEKYFIFRAGWMMGGGERDKKYIMKVLRLIDKGNKTLYGLTDKYGCPTYTLDFAQGILKMITKSKDYGLYHMVSNGDCSRFDVSRKLVEVLGLDDVDVVPVTGDFFKETFPAPRPTLEVIENKKLKDKGMDIMRNWEEALEEYIREFYVEKYQHMRRREIHSRNDLGSRSKNEPLVSVVTTSYNTSKFHEKYFQTLGDQTYKNIELILVDNMSTDDTIKSSKDKLKNGKIVISKVNDGCASGNNMGVLEATGKYIFLLGPDAWIDRNCIKKLVEEAEKNENYIYAPKQMTYDGSEFIGCGIAADFFGYPARTYTRDGRIQTKRVFYADGSGVFMTRKNYLRVGMMDESTFLFAEDVDLSWKAHMLGMDVVPVHSSIVYHFSGGSVGIGGYPKDTKYQTSGNRRFLAERNMIRNILKNYKWWNVLWVLPFFLLVNLFEMFALILTGQARLVSETYLKAYLWNINNFKSTLVKRKIIQSTRTVSDFEIMKKLHIIPHKFLALLELGVPRIN